MVVENLKPSLENRTVARGQMGTCPPGAHYLKQKRKNSKNEEKESKIVCLKVIHS